MSVHASYSPNLPPEAPSARTEGSSSSGDPVCTICLEATSQRALVETECHHFFHSRCLENWKVRSPTCPNCRQSLGEVPGSNNPSRDADMPYMAFQADLENIPTSNYCTTMGPFSLFAGALVTIFLSVIWWPAAVIMLSAGLLVLSIFYAKARIERENRQEHLPLLRGA